MSEVFWRFIDQRSNLILECNDLDYLLKELILNYKYKLPSILSNLDTLRKESLIKGVAENEHGESCNIIINKIEPEVQSVI